jgi:hypothetical protein
VQRLAQRAQQRDRAGDRSLVVKVGPALGGGLMQRAAVLGQQKYSAVSRKTHRPAANLTKFVIHHSLRVVRIGPNQPTLHASLLVI